MSTTDVISDSMTHIATTASKQRKLVIVCSVIAIAGLFAGSLYLTKRNSYRAQANEALFKARQTLDSELKAFSESLKPAAKPKSAKKPAEETAAPNVMFMKFPVEEKLKGGIAALERVSEDYSSTLAGFDAKMQLASLYFDHATDAAAYEKAAKWFERAANGAPSSDHAGAALYGLGYTQEALGKCDEAVKTFERAANSGANALLGDLLRAQARCYETLGDSANAKKTYERIEKELPQSEDAQFAARKKASL